MPPRREPTEAELRARYLRQREQAKVRMRRLRERQALRATGVPVTNGDGNGGVPVTPPPRTPSPALSTREPLEERLAPFAARGFRYDPGFFARLQAVYGAVDVELEVAAALDWLDEPRNARRRCSKRFLQNWIKKADADRQQRERQAAAPPAPKSVPPGGVKNPGPAPVLPADVVLERIDPRVAQRALLEAQRFSLKEKLALVKNGRAG